MDVTAPTEYSKIAKIAKDTETEFGVHPNIIFYMAVAPQLVPTIVKNLGKLDICHDTKCTRIVVEKPFGHDLESAKEMNKMLRNISQKNRYFALIITSVKKQYKTYSRCVLPTLSLNLFGTGIILNYVQITASETVGVEGRGGYYDDSGALRDMIQNHILQLLCMIGMEAPVSFDANEIRNKKVDVLNAIRRISKDEVQDYAARGQYATDGCREKKFPAIGKKKM